MAGEEEFSEEYIAELLKKDAQKVSASYARSGIYDVLPKRPTGSAPKPNTRFLQNIIRSTDSHNAALKQKELGDAASRLRALTRERSDGGHSHSRYRDTEDRNGKRGYGQHKRKQNHQQDGPDNYRDLEHGSRSSKRHASERRRGYPSKHNSQEKGRSRHRSHQKDRHDVYSDREADSYNSSAGTTDSELAKQSSKKRKKQDSPRNDRNDEYDKEHNPSSRRHQISRDRNRARHKHRSSNESISPEDKHRHSRSHRKQKKSSTEQSPSSESSASESRAPSRTSKSRQSTRRSSHSYDAKNIHRRTKHERESTPTPSISPDQDQDLSDDPLIPFLGPLPPSPDPVIRVRGRGATSNLSGTNKRFSASYNPATDVALDDPDEGEDWEQALEALRDRQQFRQVGVDRLLAAGFSKDEVARMERGGERDETDVKWSKKGQAREWDRGKVIDKDGNVSIEANRLNSVL